MDNQTLVDNLLALPEEQLEAFLHANQADLTADVMDEFEARINQLRLQDPNKALRIAELMLLAAGHFADERVYANALRLKGNVFIYLGRYQESISCYEAAKPIRMRYGEQLEVARLQVGWSAALLKLARYDDALQLSLATREILLEHEKWDWLANLEMNIGEIYRLTDRYNEALAIYEQARQHFELAGNPVGAAQAEINASYLMGNQDRFREAHLLLHQVRTVFITHEKWLLLARTDLNLAILYSRLGYHHEAWQKFNQARERFKQLDNEIEVASVDLYHSYVYSSLNLFPETLELANNARSIFEQRGTKHDVALAELSLASAYREQGKKREAEQLLQKARSFFTANKGSIGAALIDLQRAALLRETNRQSEAIVLIEQAIKLFATHQLTVRQAQAQLLLAECYYDLQQIAQARPLYETILNMPDELRLPTLAYRAHDGLGRVAEAEGQPKAALASYQVAIKELETIRQNLRVDEFKASFLDDKLTLYQAAVRLSIEMQQLTEAFDYVEQAKSSALLDLLAQNLELRAKGGSAEDQETWQRLRELKEKWRWQQSKLQEAPSPPPTPPNSEGGEQEEEQTRWARGMRDEAWEELASIEGELNQLWRQVQGQHIKSLTAEAKHTWRAVSELLDSETVLVEYFFVEDEVVAFLLRSNDPELRRRAVTTNLEVVRDFPYSRREIERSLRALELALKRVSGLDLNYVNKMLTPLARRHLNWLYEALIRPLMPALAGYRKLIIVPDDLLYMLPFHALHDGQEYLIDQFELHYAPSASVLALCHQRKASKQKNNPSTSSGHHHQGLPFPPKIGPEGTPDGGGAALVIGYSHDGHLPQVINEVQTIAGTFPSALLFEEEDATVANLRQHARDCRLLHLASHAKFREDNPLFSCLELADEPLNVIDIYHLELNASLVTLSACETGINQLTGGDLFGLARGCFYAGAPSLVASLWRVDDASTALLMQEFYRRLQTGQPIAHALRAAQLALRQIEEEQDGQIVRPYDNPHYWAPFFLMGADGVL